MVIWVDAGWYGNDTVSARYIGGEMSEMLHMAIWGISEPLRGDPNIIV